MSEFPSYGANNSIVAGSPNSHTERCTNVTQGTLKNTLQESECSEIHGDVTTKRHMSKMSLVENPCI